MTAHRLLADALRVSAVIDVITTVLVPEPRRIGCHAVAGELGGIWSARRGTYRIL